MHRFLNSQMYDKQNSSLLNSNHESHSCSTPRFPGKHRPQNAKLVPPQNIREALSDLYYVEWKNEKLRKTESERKRKRTTNKSLMTDVWCRCFGGTIRKYNSFFVLCFSHEMSSCMLNFHKIHKCCSVVSSLLFQWNLVILNLVTHTSVCFNCEEVRLMASKLASKLTLAN